MHKVEEARAGTARDAHDYQVLTFTLGNETYGVDILRVQEIKGFAPITPIPNTPHYVKGVINLRGNIIPVVDLRARFEMDPIEYDQFRVIVVVMVGKKVMGLVVDAVSDVLQIPKAAIQPTPDISLEVNSRFIAGLSNAKDGLVILLDIDEIVHGKEIAVGALEQTTS